MPSEDNSQLIRRLRSAGGHLQAVTSMVESGEPCEQVLHQLNAVQGALKAAARILLDEHIRESELIIKSSDCPDERAQALDYLVMLYHWTFNQK